MKIKIILVALMTIGIIGLIGTASTVVANDRNTKKSVITETSTEIAAQATAVFEGIVKKTKSGIVLVCEKETYALKGEGLEEFIGRNVAITGTLVKGDTINTIIVVEAESAKL
ncbi:MAG: hypothetical protein K8R67_01515 [Desulfobacteraceae bacterium]|nr:hypothetical protein [Desulfobacteraceae bacterium]